MRIAFTCEPDAYLTEGRTMMGRRSAGAAFLRAAVEAMPPDQPFVLFGGKRSGAAEIANAAAAISVTRTGSAASAPTADEVGAFASPPSAVSTGQ